MDCRLPGSSVHGIFQAILEWVAIPSPRSSPPAVREHVTGGYNKESRIIKMAKHIRAPNLALHVFVFVFCFGKCFIGTQS